MAVTARPSPYTHVSAVHARCLAPSGLSIGGPFRDGKVKNSTTLSKSPRGFCLISVNMHIWLRGDPSLVVIG